MRPAYLVIDTESVPDGKLLAMVKYSGLDLTPEQAIARAQQEARSESSRGSDFLPVSFQIPVAVCLVEAAADFSLQHIACLDAPHFRTQAMVEAFWTRHRETDATVVSFNGEAFDLPLLELAAFRYGLGAGPRFKHRGSADPRHLDLFRWLTNDHAFRLVGGLNLLSKLLGKPGKFETRGDQIHRMHVEGRHQEINDYCLFDTLDTYFVFLRTRVLTGDLSIDQEHHCVLAAKRWLEANVATIPALNRYLDNWGDWKPW
jgi:predicted PolB exonuclease-like 3'-5' exonuclease